MTPRIVHADAILPGEDAPIRDGAVVIDADGTVLEVGRAAEVLPRHAGAPIERTIGVLLPGLVNAHAHVELSSLRGKVTGGHGFVPWVDRMMGLRASERPEEDGDSMERAAAEMENSGTIAVGEVTNTLAAVSALTRHGIGGAVFHEVFGLDRGPALAKLGSMAEERAALVDRWRASGFTVGPAPHTVYTTHPEVIRAALAEARANGSRTTVHLAEHAAERTFLVHGNGPFLDFATRMRFPVERFPVPHKGPVDVAADLGLLAPDVLLVHLTDIRSDELDRVAASGAPVVLCPRSNLFIEVKLPPLLELLKVGIVPALGTDSLASNSTLDVLAEARALADRFPSVSAHVLVRMATAAGADALGRPDLGRLAKGVRPSLLAVLGPLGPTEDPCSFVLRQPVAKRKWVVRNRGGGRNPESFA
jgi:cytosine/adenosine deaminase-related metal-dependent hydrolase